MDARLKQDRDEFEDYGNYGMRDERAVRKDAEEEAPWRPLDTAEARAAYEAYRRGQLGSFALEFEEWQRRERLGLRTEADGGQTLHRLAPRHGVVIAEGNDITSTPSDSPFDFPQAEP